MKKIVSMHIPKTAGTTFYEYLKVNYENNIKLIYTKPIVKRCNNIDNEINKIILNGFNEKVIHGHFIYDEVEINKDYYYLTWLRDPVERVISHYYYFKYKPTHNYIHPIEYKIKEENLSLLEFINIKCMQNLQSYYFGVTNIEKFNFIGIVEKFDESLKVLEADLKIQYVQKRVMKARVNSNKEEVSNELKALIQELNQEDYILYNKVLKKYNWHSND